MKPRKIINEGEILMKNIKRNLLICLLVVFCSVALAGCNNKVKDELAAANDKIAELEKQLEEANANKDSIAKQDRKSTRLNSSHRCTSRMPSSA